MACVKRYDLVATGGTFDIIHKGHMALLAESFEVSRKVIIGLVGDEMARRRNKNPANNYSQRLEALSRIIEKNFAGAVFEISRLDDDFGPAVLQDSVQALIVSDETRGQGDVLNEMRAKRGLGPVEIVTVPMVLAKDGLRISSSRIRSSEIDSAGNLS